MELAPELINTYEIKLKKNIFKDLSMNLIKYKILLNTHKC